MAKAREIKIVRDRRLVRHCKYEGVRLTNGVRHRLAKNMETISAVSTDENILSDISTPDHDRLHVIRYRSERRVGRSERKY